MKIGTAVLAYNRVNHFKKVINAIIKEKIQEINVYIDGPENNSIYKNQLKIIEVVNKNKNKIKINLIKQTKNNGLAFSVINAVESELKNNDAMILIEDDCVPQKGFFQYMYSTLKKYKKNKNIKSVCSYNNLNLNDKNSAFFLKRFNPWGWATWKDRWKQFDPLIKNAVNKLNLLGKVDKLPTDLKNYCKNDSILQGKQDIWSLSWTLSHYMDDSLVVYPPISLIKNIGFDGSGVHCLKTNIFNVKNNSNSNKIFYPKDIMSNLLNELKNENFLVQNSSKTFFSSNKLDSIQPYHFIRKTDHLTLDQINYYLERFVFSTKVVDIHTHLYPSQFKSFYKKGIIELLNYHYLVAEFLSSTKFKPVKFYELTDYKKAKIIWDELFLKKTPFSTSTMGILKILQKYEIKSYKISFEKLHKEFDKRKLDELDIFDLAGVKQVVMTNNPFLNKELRILNENKNSKYKSSIRLDDLFSTKNISKIKDIKTYEYIEKLIKKYNPAYFAISTNNFEEFKFKSIFNQVLKILRKYNKPLMLLVGVKRKVNPEFELAGDGLGQANLNFLQEILKHNSKNRFLVTCLDHVDHFRLIVLARKFQNLQIFGFWWFTNQESIIKNTLNLRIEMLNDNFIPQHSDARVIDQLIYKWNDFRHYYTSVYANKYRQLVQTGFKIKPEDIERNVYNQFVEKPSKLINIK
jgi:hypothetical protein